ncbi:MAG TPA: D-alanyl-D-alanine carboxypeptidase/D-alanyl-D-alanine-endopeptidase [Gemmatimonadales bacterium]|nr:D-alanyl-D-alanine carboxypeptidase/D-alanyl-D-alanine-endopeptidase [Gemmatimonadales bacterium]
MSVNPLRLGISAALLALVLGASSRASAQTLTPAQERSLTNWLKTAKRYAPGRWGVAVANQQGDLLWGQREDEFFTPASTVKLLTTGYARTRLGGSARLATRVLGNGEIDSTGAWVGNWALELNGDPTFDRATREGRSLNELAGLLSEAGVRKLSGPLNLTSATGTPNAVYPTTWAPGHWGRVFAPLVGAVTLNENIVWLTVGPGRKIGSVGVLVGSAPQGLDALVSMHVRTVGGYRSRLSVRRMADGGFLINGTVGLHARPRRLVSVSTDPKAVLAEAWARALQNAGIVWERERRIQTESLPDSMETIAEVTSAPLDSIATEINTRSLNIGAELLLRWASGKDNGGGDLTEHVADVTGISDGARLVDGSGLSHDDKVKPTTFIAYLAKFPGTAAGRNFPMLLPANGEGTLVHLRGGMGAGVVHAKTGTLNDVSTLVGYLGRKDGVLLISLMYNGGRVHTAKKQQWKLFRLLGADGVEIPSDSLPGDDEATSPDEQLGGDVEQP